MKDPADCKQLGTPCLGSIYCEHRWNWSGEVVTTSPLKQHRRCVRCGRKECVSVCKFDMRIEDCRDPECDGHWDRYPVPANAPVVVNEPKGYYNLRNGILQPN